VTLPILGLLGAVVGFLATTLLLDWLAQPGRKERHGRAFRVLLFCGPLLFLAMALGLVRSMSGYPARVSLEGSFRVIAFVATPPDLDLWVAPYQGGSPRVVRLPYGREVGEALESRRADLVNGTPVLIHGAVITGHLRTEETQQIDFVDAQWRPTHRIRWRASGAAPVP
jgi:hypothetical protein